MKLTTQQQEMMARCGLACNQAGNDIQVAKASVHSVTVELSKLIDTLEDPGERLSASTIRQTWFELEAKLDECIAKFERG